MSKITINNDDLSLTVDTCGGEITSIIKKGIEYIWQRNDDEWSLSAPILFPICGSLKEDTCEYDGKKYSMPQHGFLIGKEFEVETKTEDSLSLSYTYNQETLKMYPFKFKFMVIFSLEDSGVKITYRVENLSDKTMYYSVGGHESYAIDSSIDNCTIDFSYDEDLKDYNVTGPLLDGAYNQIESKNHIDLCDDYFTVDAIILKNLNSDTVVLTDKGSNKKITLKFSDFTNLLIWKIVGLDYVCLEPWTGLPDSIDSKGILSKKDSISELPAGETKDIVHTIIPE